MDKIKNNEDRYNIGQKVLRFTIVLNILLAAGKITIGVISKSNAILADGIHTLSDIGSSIGLIIGFFIAKRPEDAKHQYGHEKAESIATLLLSVLLIMVGAKIGFSSVKLIFIKKALIPGVSAIWAAAISIIIKEIQFRICKKVGNKINSSALIADAWHHRSDSLSSVAVLIGVVGARLGYSFLDPLAGVIVSCIVIKIAIEIFLKAYNELMDVSIEDDKLKDILKKVNLLEGVEAINYIKTRKHGSMVYIDIAIAVKHDITVAKGHEIAESVENLIYSSVNNVKNVLVHVNPCTNDIFLNN